MFDTVVIGAGIFGSLITRALRRLGMSVLALDAKLENSGSRPAACLMRPGWFSSLGKEVYDPALKRLDELVGVQDLTFRVNKMATATVHWCDPKRVLLDQNEVRTGRVVTINNTVDGWLVIYDGGEKKAQSARAKYVFLATGIWTPMLYSGIEVQAQAGVAWLWPSGKIQESFVSVWAPYKQIVAFNRGDGLWAGDGLSIRKWNTAYDEASYKRCTKELLRRFQFIEGFSDSARLAEVTRLFGYRPYVKEAKPCFLKEVRPRLWVATGGAKNGTLAAGWCVDQIMRKIA